MKKILLTLFLMSWVCFQAGSQQLSPNRRLKQDKKLERLLASLIRDFPGDAGIYVQHLKKGRYAAIHADTIFPTASMIKIPIMAGIFHQIEQGRLQYEQQLTYTDSLYYPGEDILGSFKNGEKIALSKAVMLMITMSDNTAALWCQSLAGGGAAINDFLASGGFKNTRVNSRTEGRHDDWEVYGWGQTTPREMATLLLRIRRGSLVSPAASERMYRNLSTIYWDRNALSQIPPYVHTASKQGAVNQSRSEVVMVDAPGGSYVFCVITKNQEDQRWEYDNEGRVLIRNVARTLWNYYESTADWKPAEGIKKYYIFTE